MTAYIITLVNGWTVVSSDGAFLYGVHSGEPAVTVRAQTRTYHIPTASIVCVQEADE